MTVNTLHVTEVWKILASPRSTVYMWFLDTRQINQSRTLSHSTKRKLCFEGLVGCLCKVLKQPLISEKVESSKTMNDGSPFRATQTKLIDLHAIRIKVRPTLFLKGRKNLKYQNFFELRKCFAEDIKSVKSYHALCNVSICFSPTLSSHVTSSSLALLLRLKRKGKKNLEVG